MDIDEQTELDVVTESTRQLIKDSSVLEHTILLSVRITSTNPDPQVVVKRAMRELELTFGDAVRLAYSEFHPK